MLFRQLSLEEIEKRREALRQLKKDIESGERSLDSLSLEEKTCEAKVDENQFEFLAFSRVLSGTVRKGQTLFILSPKHDPENFVGKVRSFSNSLENLY